MTIEVVRPEDEQAWHEWHGPVLAVELDAFPDEPPFGADARRALHLDVADEDWVLLASRAETGEVVGSAGIALPKHDNLRVAELDVNVAPGLRGQGIGRSLLEAVEAVAAERGRTVLICNTFGRTASVDSRDARFARASGYSPARREVRRDLQLPLRPGLLEELLAANAEAAPGYDTVRWWGSCPDELLAGRVRLAETISADEPKGDLATERQTWDERRFRNWEASVAKMGRELSGAGAVERRSGQLVAATEIGMARPGEDLGRQFATVVAREHRGHRLGIVVKIANLQQVLAHERPPRRICTWNGETNQHMVRVNEELGFEVAGQAVNWQKTLR